MRRTKASSRQFRACYAALFHYDPPAEAIIFADIAPRDRVAHRRSHVFATVDYTKVLAAICCASLRHRCDLQRANRTEDAKRNRYARPIDCERLLSTDHSSASSVIFRDGGGGQPIVNPTGCPVALPASRARLSSNEARSAACCGFMPTHCTGVPKSRTTLPSFTPTAN